MTTLLLVLAVLAAGLLARWTIHRLDPRVFRPAAPLSGWGPPDRDVERQLAELRGLRAYREDPPLFP